MPQPRYRTRQQAPFDLTSRRSGATRLCRNPRKISEALKLVTEEDIWAKAAVRLNEWNHGRTSMTAQSLKQQHNSITDQRNRIAHDADLLDGDLKRRRPISDADVIDAIDWIERIALAVAAVLG